LLNANSITDGSASSAAESSDSLGMNAGAEGDDVVAHGLHVLLHELLAAGQLGVVRGGQDGGGVEVGVERHLRVDRDALAAREGDDHVGA
jgi:hypothetical protein